MPVRADVAALTLELAKNRGRIRRPRPRATIAFSVDIERGARRRNLVEIIRRRAGGGV